MSALRSPDPVSPYILPGMTATTGIVDAVSLLALGQVFTTNMTGNVLFLGFALALSRRSNGFLILVEEIHRSSRRCPSAQRI
jgi:hypothetical protein